MSRTQRRWDGDLGYADGHIFVPVAANFVSGAGAAQAVSYNGITSATLASLPTAATAYVATVPLNSWLFRYGVQDDIQEQFGGGGLGGDPFGSNALAVGNISTVCTTTAGPTGGNPVTLTVTSTVGFVIGNVVQIDTGASAEFQLVTAIPSGTTITIGQLAKSHTANYTITQNPFTSAAGASGSPPFTGVTNLTSLTAPRPKGIQFNRIYPVYSIANGVAAPTVNTIGIISTQFANAAALTTANVLAVAANGLQTAANAANQAYVTPIAITAGQQVYKVTRFTEFVVQWNVTTGAATGTAGLFGIFFDVTYNFV